MKKLQNPNNIRSSKHKCINHKKENNIKRIWLVYGLFWYILLAISMPCCTHAQSLQKGNDAVITFRNHPAKTNAVAKVKKAAAPFISTAPFASTTYWAPGEFTPSNWDYDHIGEVFGTAINSNGDVYFAATAMYAQILNFGGNYKTHISEPSSSISIAGSSAHPSGGNAGIYKASASNLASIANITTTVNAPSFASIGTNQIPNRGYGIGNIAVSNTHQKIYATNLEDGKIYALNYNTGIISDVFDPFIPDPADNKIAEYGERLFGIAVNHEFDGSIRVYYSRLVATTSVQNEIWSIQVDAAGNFIPATNSLEIQLKSNYHLNFISDIAFSVRGEMALAEKGDNHNAQGYVFFGKHNAWSLPLEPYLGTYGLPAYNSAGGVDFANYYVNTPTGSRIICDSLIWYSVNAMKILNDNLTYGFQSLPYTGYVNNTTTTFRNEAHFIPLIDTNYGADWKSAFGDIEFSDSGCVSQPTDICSFVSAGGQMDTSCCLNLMVQNGYFDNYFSAIIVATSNLNIANNTNGTTWASSTILSPQAIKFSQYETYMPKTDTAFLLSKLCFEGTGPDVLNVYFIGNAPQYDTVCIKQIPIAGCADPVDTSCLAILRLDDTCINGVNNMIFQVKNNSYFTMRGISILNINPNVKPLPDWFFPIADLNPGSTSPVYTVPLDVQNNDSVGCFYFSACDVNIRPGTTGPTPNFCCIDSIAYCVKLEKCNPCDAFEITAKKTDPQKCCYTLSLDNHYASANIGCMTFKGLGGTQFSILSSWSIVPPVSSSMVTACAPGAGLLTGTYADFASFCLTGTATPPYGIAVEIYDVDGNLLCIKELSFDSCELAQPTCANIINDSLYCDGEITKLKFDVKNNSPFTILQVDVRMSDTSFTTTPNIVLPTPPLAPGTTAGPFVIEITRGDTAIDNVCMYLTAHNGVYTDSTSATICCTDSLGVICLPFLNCDSSACPGCDTACCDFKDLILPTGLTPNNDAINETYTIQNAQLCDQIKMVVYNRWGNIVYKDDNYNNNWKGTNNKGETLPQGTYFVVLQLPNGSKKGTYVDIRY